MKTGDKIKCIDTNGFCCLTKDGEYTLRGIAGGGLVRIINDAGYEQLYPLRYFQAA